MNVADVVVLVAFASLVVELTVFPIPSEASTLQLLTTDARVGGEGDGDLQRARARSLLQKVLVFAVPTVTGVALFLLPLVGIAFPSSRAALFPWTLPALLWPGVALVVVGRAVTFGSVLQLRRAKRAQAIPGGMFRISRNPGLCGMYLFYLGLCAIYGGPWLWLGIPLYLGNMHHRVRLEEAQLEQRHGEQWRAYARRVARYLPLPGLR